MDKLRGFVFSKRIFSGIANLKTGIASDQVAFRTAERLEYVGASCCVVTERYALGIDAQAAGKMCVIFTASARP
jgi:hypothetical protein